MNVFSILEVSSCLLVTAAVLHSYHRWNRNSILTESQCKSFRGVHFPMKFYTLSNTDQNDQ